MDYLIRRGLMTRLDVGGNEDHDNAGDYKTCLVVAYSVPGTISAIFHMRKARAGRDRDSSTVSCQWQRWGAD